MERGTEWERDAVSRRWAALERQRVQATRLLVALLFVLAGVTLALLGVTRKACLGDGGRVPTCTTITSGPPLLLAGGVAVVAGCWVAWIGLRS
jgi:hypothetical protein